MPIFHWQTQIIIAPPIYHIISPCSIPLKSPGDLVVYTTAMGPMGHQSVSLASDWAPHSHCIPGGGASRGSPPWAASCWKRQCQKSWQRRRFLAIGCHRNSWFTMIYLWKMVMFHSCANIPDGKRSKPWISASWGALSRPRVQHLAEGLGSWCCLLNILKHL